MFVGLDGAGKSTLLQTLVGEDDEPTVPTVGFDNVSLPAATAKQFGAAQFEIEVFDLGGGKRIRSIWYAYVADAFGVVFVVDSADVGKLDEAREVLHELIKDPQLDKKPIAVFANKQDLPNAKSDAEIAKALGLDLLESDRVWIAGCTSLRSASSKQQSKQSGKDTLDVGVKKSFSWLLEKIKSDWPALLKRVAIESKAFREKEELLKKERVERGKLAKKERLEQEALESAKSQKKSASKKNQVTPLPEPVETPQKSSDGANVVPGAFGSPLEDPPPGGAWTPAPT